MTVTNKNNSINIKTLRTDGEFQVKSASYLPGGFLIFRVINIASPKGCIKYVHIVILYLL